MTCTVCGEGTLVLLGRLGQLVWVRCRACGLDQAIHHLDYEELEHEEEQ